MLCVPPVFPQAPLLTLSAIPGPDKHVLATTELL